jgi:hypothetical protein
MNTRQTHILFKFFQSNTTVCLIICVFCKICDPERETEIVFGSLFVVKTNQKQFHVHIQVHKTYKTRKSTLLCIGNFEENIVESRIHLGVHQ